MKRGSFAAGFLTCLLLAGITTTAYAAGIMAERSTNHIFVDGQEVQIEAYTIHGNNFMQLRDVGKAVGFNVYWSAGDGSVRIETGRPYTGEAPAQTSAAKTVTLPTDGSRYVPAAGDVIRCDDGSNYTITDVSRYDASAFASGPLSELPAPTCDWSCFPAVTLPTPDARHFQNGESNTLFVRNLYEMRRMLYTLYNAIGNNPETWQDGKPILHPSGNQKVLIFLTIPADQQAESFWPWRESEIVDPFNARPCGSYYMECWDVYKDGVFLRTEYDVLTTT